MEAGEVGTQKAKTHDEARRLLDDAWARANKAYKEAKEQADIVYEEVKKVAADKEAKQRADDAHKEALKEAKKVRDAITAVAQSVFTDFWRQQDIDAQDAAAKSKERGDLAQKVYKETKEQANVLHEEAKKTAVDGAARKQADEAHQEAVKQAKKVYDETVPK